jgi:enoyl-[acyl-carrier protein] reductase II
LNRHSRPGLRALRTERTTVLERQESVDLGEAFGSVLDLYFGGDLEAGVALTGQVAGRIDAVRSVADIIDDCVAGFHETIARLSTYGAAT